MLLFNINHNLLIGFLNGAIDNLGYNLWARNTHFKTFTTHCFN